MTIDQFNKSLKQIIKSNDALKANSLLVVLLKEVEENYQQEILKTYQQVSHGKMEEQDISTFFNLNREVYNSCKSLIQAAQDYILNNQTDGGSESK
jgi:phosphate:Na+ symporter